MKDGAGFAGPILQEDNVIAGTRTACRCGFTTTQVIQGSPIDKADRELHHERRAEEDVSLEVSKLLVAHEDRRE